MHLAPIEAQTCGFLFQKSATFKVKYDPLVKTGEVTATMADLQCLRPPRQISPLIMQLNAERLRFEQEENNGDFVWHLPPSFEDDLLAGTKVQEMTAKYCSKWMPPSPNLKFIYVPLRTIHGHWYLIIVDMEHGVIYHLDSFLTVDFMEVRRRRIRKIADMIHHLVLDPMYSSSFGNKHIDFKNMSITEARGIPNMGCSDNSGVWVLDWGESAHCIDLKNLPGKLNENEVRMTTAAKLMLGKHNELKAKVEHHTSMFIDSFPSDTPINLDA
ncbi:putative Ulp1 protease family catalytic domain-containing protein [Medicago truncatula]|nr:putative Ulp1 protease family catalytic domain-containing protein [Medicago truncatula]